MMFCLFAGLALFPVSALADDDPSIRACDLSAASPDDLARPAGIAGVDSDKIDPKTALPFCQAALESAPENPRLQFELGRIFEVMQAYGPARDNYEKSANQGYLIAQQSLARLPEQGRGGPVKNDKDAASLYKLEAEQGDATAEEKLGVLYRDGHGGLGKNDQEAARLFKLAADQGNSDAQADLGFFYETGRGGLAQSDEEAARLYKLAADAGNALAEGSLGVFYRDGRGGLARSDQEAARYFKLAADKGNASAQLDLGLFYETGRGGLAKSEREAARLYKLAADAGNAVAADDIAVFYRDGRGGLAKSDRQAAHYFKLAADKGNADAQANLGAFYADGRGGLAKNDREAARLFKLAADQGIASAESGLGSLYEQGRGVGQDFAQAMAWDRKAADQGDARAENNIGALYEHGQGVKQDDAQAVAWYRKAADRGDATALGNWRRLTQPPVATAAAEVPPVSSPSALSWQQHEESSTGQGAKEVAAQVVFSDGNTLQAFAKCGEIGLDFDFSTFRGSDLTPLPYAWRDNEIQIPLRIDGGAQAEVHAYTQDPHANQITIGFYDPTVAERYVGSHASLVTNVVAGGTTNSADWDKFVAGTGGQLNDLLGAASIRIELPLADGSADFAEINPRNPVLNAFAQRCNASLQQK